MAEMTPDEKKKWLAATEKNNNSGLNGVFKRTADAVNAKKAAEKESARPPMSKKWISK
jgi:hypothetical protein